MNIAGFDDSLARLHAGDAAGARAGFAAAAAAGDRRAQVVHTNFLAAGFGGPRDWAGALSGLAAMAEWGARWGQELAAIGGMALTADGEPLAVPAPEAVSERPHVVRFRGLFTAGECAYLRGVATPLLAPSVVIDPRTGAQRLDPERTSHAAGFNVLLESPAVHALNRRIAAASGTAAAQGEPLQVLRYGVGGEYRPHLDAIPGFQNQRVLTMLVWLNDGFEGGETQFPLTGLTLRGEPGDAILFRNTGEDGRQDPLSRHAGLPVARGEKWLASRWIRARPFDYARPR
ncbi:MAG: 2OG-Fe(II) oxygenase [Alphaproteobacteria bacterium]|nr:2OG-Fe(II) oxygenase [Alphaproteobacteria bacterium]